MLLQRALGGTRCVIVLNRFLESRYRELGLAGDRILVVGSGADGRKFREPKLGGDGRERLGIGSEARIVCYAGGTVAPAEVPRYLMMADVLVAPNSARSISSALYTSPLKFFEYASAGKPIVASDVPALRSAAAECLGSRVFWASPDDPLSLAAAVREALERSREPGAGGQPPPEIEWSRRAEAILAFVSSERS